MDWNSGDLLEAALEFDDMVPDDDSWTKEKLRSNPPRFIRLTRIEALLKAFNLNYNSDMRQNIQALLAGSFIPHRNISTYADIIDLIQPFQRPNRERPITATEIQWLYRVLLDYKTACRRVFHTNNFLEAGNIGIHCGLNVTQPINEALENLLNNSELDRVLLLIIDPEKRSFSEEELIEKYNFPKDDLRAIDIDWC
jgi:hypothetical protein